MDSKILESLKTPEAAVILSVYRTLDYIKANIDLRAGTKEADNMLGFYYLLNVTCRAVCVHLALPLACCLEQRGVMGTLESVLQEQMKLRPDDPETLKLMQDIMTDFTKQ